MMRILDLVFRLMLAFAVLAGMAFALVATTQSAHAYGAYAFRSFGSPFGAPLRLGGHDGALATGATQAEANANALAACEAATIPGRIEYRCGLRSSNTFVNVCAALVGGVHLNTRESVPPPFTPDPTRPNIDGNLYFGKSPVGGTPAQAVEAARAACDASGFDNRDMKVKCDRAVVTGLNGAHSVLCDSTCTEPMIAKTDGNAGCRARIASDCTGNTPILDSGVCRARQHRDCTGNTPVLDSGFCRARRQSDCTGFTPIFDSGFCRPRQPSDCTGFTPDFFRGECVAACVEPFPVRNGNTGNCQTRPIVSCPDNAPILDNGNCRAATRADCRGDTPDLVGGKCVAACPSGQVRNQAEACVQESWLAFAATPLSVPGAERAVAFAYNAATEAEARMKAIEECNRASSSSTPCTVPVVYLDANNNGIEAATRGCAAFVPYRFLLTGTSIRYGYEVDFADDLTFPLATVEAIVESNLIYSFEDGISRLLERGERIGFCPSVDRPLAYTTATWESLIVVPMALTTTLATPTLTIVITAKAPDQGRCNNDGVMGTELNADGTACVCPSGKTLLSDGNVHACVDPLPSAATNFLASDCTSAGWLWGYTADPTGKFRQDCLVPSRIVNAPPPASGGGDVNRPASIDALQVSANSDVDACVISRHAGFDTTAAGATDNPECNDQNLFASLGFPQKPADISHSDILTKSKRITVQLAAGGAADATPDIVYNNTTLAHYSAPSGGGGGGGGGGSGAGIAIGVAAVVGLIALATWSGDSDSFTFSPDVGLNYDSQSGHILRYGSRVDFRENAWHAWWSAAQTNSRNGTGKLRYGSGAEYAGEFWNARLKSDAYGEKSDSAFSLSAEKELGVWSFVPLYRVQYAKDETDESWRHSLTLKAVWRVNQWTLTNSAGFYGKSLAAFGDNASAKVLLRREF